MQSSVALKSSVETTGTLEIGQEYNPKSCKMQVQRAVSQSGVLSSGAFHLLIILMDYAGKNGIAWPSYQTLAIRMARTRRYVIRLVNELKSSGLVEAHKIVYPNGKRGSNRYTFNWTLLLAQTVKPDIIVSPVEYKHLRGLVKDSTPSVAKDSSPSAEGRWKRGKNRKLAEVMESVAGRRQTERESQHGEEMVFSSSPSPIKELRRDLEELSPLPPKRGDDRRNRRLARKPTDMQEMILAIKHAYTLSAQKRILEIVLRVAPVLYSKITETCHYDPRALAAYVYDAGSGNDPAALFVHKLKCRGYSPSDRAWEWSKTAMKPLEHLHKHG